MIDDPVNIWVLLIIDEDVRSHPKSKRSSIYTLFNDKQSCNANSEAHNDG